MVMSLYIAGSRPWRPKPRLSSRAEHAVDVDSRRNWHWPSSSPPDSHRQVLEMYQEQPGTETDQNLGPFVDFISSDKGLGCFCTKNNHVQKQQDNKHLSSNFPIIRLVATMWPAASASLAAT